MPNPVCGSLGDEEESEVQTHHVDVASIMPFCGEFHKYYVSW